MSGKKRIILIIILLAPPLIFFFFSLTQANAKRMAHYGPVTFDPAKKDSIHYSVPLKSLMDSDGNHVLIDTVNFPVILVGFLQEKFRPEGYKLRGLLDYTQYERQKLDGISILLVASYDTARAGKLKKEFRILNKDIHELYCPAAQFDSVNQLFFREKPIYVFNHFLALLDKKRNIRGYFDPNQSAEMKRMISEFKFLMHGEKTR